MGVIFWRFLLQYASPALGPLVLKNTGSLIQDTRCVVCRTSFLHLIRVGGLEFENLPRDTCDIGILNRDYGGSLPANV